MPVEGLEQGLGRATEPAASLAWLLAMGAVDSFAPGSGALQGWLWEGLESRPAGLEFRETRLAPKLVLCFPHQTDPAPPW